ncbi:casein kinase I isoform alpha [Panus rudis PR-1116 ss-1]|nr:casein kinase I isoform alpha [Panus rudis PR-1116 ss-1]
MSSIKVEPVMSVHVRGRYRVKQSLETRSFGKVFLGHTLDSSRQNVTIKFKPRSVDEPQLYHEYEMYKSLEGGIGIPSLLWFGTERDHTALVTQLLGPTLERVFNTCHHQFSLTTVISLADQMLSRIEYLHSRDIIHRDLKPENFLIGTGSEQSTIYLIDFGLSTYYHDRLRGRHIPYAEKFDVTGTARYLSINGHLGMEQSHQDDLESLALILIYFLRGSLPWQGLLGQPDLVVNEKLAIPMEDLCSGLSTKFATFLNYARSLGFHENPDYNYICKLFSDVLMRQGLSKMPTFNWIHHSDSLMSHGTASPNGAEQMAKPKTRSGCRWHHLSVKPSTRV